MKFCPGTTRKVQHSFDFQRNKSSRMPHFIRTWKRNALQRLWQAVAFYTYVSLSCFWCSTSMHPFPAQHISISCQKGFKYAFSPTFLKFVLQRGIPWVFASWLHVTPRCHNAHNRSRNKAISLKGTQSPAILQSGGNACTCLFIPPTLMPRTLYSSEWLNLWWHQKRAGGHGLLWKRSLLQCFIQHGKKLP